MSPGGQIFAQGPGTGTFIPGKAAALGLHSRERYINHSNSLSSLQRAGFDQVGNASLKNDQLVFTPYRPAGRHDFNPTSMINIQRVQEMDRVNPNTVASSLNHYGQPKGGGTGDGRFPDNM